MSDDPASVLYRAIDWTKCVIGGSYALKLYSNAKWPVGDIDIMCDVQSAAELLALAHGLTHSMDQRVLKERPSKVSLDKFTVLTPEMRKEAQKTNGGEERFHESILGTCTLTVPGVPMPVQMVGIDTTSHIYGKLALVDHLDYITDLPAAVQYTVAQDRPLFHVPQRAVDAIASKRIPIATICASRKAKYEARGYEFY